MLWQPRKGDNQIDCLWTARESEDRVSEGYCNMLSWHTASTFRCKKKNNKKCKDMKNADDGWGSCWLLYAALYMGLNLGQQPPFRYGGAISRNIKTLKDKRPLFKIIFGSEAMACEHSLMECQHRIRNGKCFLNAFAKMDRLLSIIFSALHFLWSVRSMTK